MAENENKLTEAGGFQIFHISPAPPEEQEELGRFLKKRGEPGYVPLHRRGQTNGQVNDQNGKQIPWPMSFKIIIEKHADGYVAYPLDLKGKVEGMGDSYEEAVADVKLAIRFHMETYGNKVLKGETPVLEAYLAEVEVGNSPG